MEIGHEVRFKAEVAFDGKELAQLLFESSEGRDILQVSWAVYRYIYTPRNELRRV